MTFNRYFVIRTTSSTCIRSWLHAEIPKGVATMAWKAWLYWALVITLACTKRNISHPVTSQFRSTQYFSLCETDRNCLTLHKRSTSLKVGRLEPVGLVNIIDSSIFLKLLRVNTVLLQKLYDEKNWTKEYMNLINLDSPYPYSHLFSYLTWLLHIGCCIIVLLTFDVLPR